MGNLGTLTLTIRQIGSGEVTAALKRIESQTKSTASSSRALYTSTVGLSSSMKKLTGDMSSGFSNANYSISNTNKGLLDIIQSLAIVGDRFRQFKNPFENLFVGAEKYNKKLSDLQDTAEELAHKISLIENAEMPLGPRKSKKLSYGKYSDLPMPKAPTFDAIPYDPSLSSIEKAAAIEAKNAQKLKAFNDKVDAINEKNLLRKEAYDKRKQAIDKANEQNQKRYEEQLEKHNKRIENITSRNNFTLSKLNKQLNETEREFSEVAEKYEPILNLLERFNKPLNFLNEITKSKTGEMFKYAAIETLKFYGATFAFAIPAMTAISKAALQASSDLQLMKMKFEAGAGGGAGAANIAEQNVKFIKALALPSTYTAQQLFEASQQMQAFGLNTEKSLITAVKLAESFGGTEETLMMITRMMGRMAAGDLPDARALGRFGMNKKAIENEIFKLQSIPGFALKGENEQFLTAFYNIIERRSGTILDKLGSTIAASAATVTEKFQFALARIGDAMAPGFTKMMNAISGLISKLESSGILDSIGKSLGTLFNEVTKPEIWAGIEKIVADMAGFFERMVENTRIMFRFFMGIYFLGTELVKLYLNFKLRGAPIILGAIDRMRQGDILGAFTRRNPFAPNPENFSQAGSIFFAENKALQPGFMEFGNMLEAAMEKRKKLLSAKIDNSLTGDSYKLFEEANKNKPFVVDEMLAKLDEQQETQKQIANNTKNISDELTLRQANLGGRGGPLANLGMSYSDMVSINAGTRNTNSPNNGNALRQQSLIAPMSYLEMGIKRLAAPSFAFRRF